MRILLINNNHFIMGGADRVYFNTGKLLEKNGHDVFYFSTLNPRNELSGFDEFFIPRKDFRKAGFIKGLTGLTDYLYNKKASGNIKRLVEKYSPDIAHIHLFYGGLSSSVIKTLYNHNIPTVMSLHDYRLLCPANSFLDSHNRICEKCRNRFYMNCIIGRCSGGNLVYSTVLTAEAYIRKYFIDPLKLIDKFIFVSEFSKLKHIEFDNRFASKSVLLYNFSEIEEKSELSVRGDYLLFFGRLSVEKGIVTLLKAFANTGIKLVIAGSGMLDKYVMKAVSESENITYVGHAVGDKLIELICFSSFVIVPSEWYENNPMTIVEANSYGKPVIASKIGGIPEIVKDGVTGYLFDPGDIDSLRNTIMKALDISDEMYSFLSQNARKNSLENFHAGKYYDKLIGIYEDTIEMK